MKTLQEMREAVKSGNAKVLTVETAKELKGKKIATIYFGYEGQDGIDEFIVGDVMREIYPNGKEGQLCLFTSYGRCTYIRAHEGNEGAFTCTDSDRFVYFIEL
jgi:hypothetical protein